MKFPFPSLVLGCVVALWMQTAAAAERVALVIGNNAYTHLAKLQNPKSDAWAVGETLKTLGFEVIALEDATVEQFYGGLEKLKAQAANAKLGLVYFAGHGVEIDGKNYLLPVDAELATPGQLRTQAIALDAVLGDLRETKLAAKLAILDCCRDDPLSREWLKTRSVGAGGLAELKEAQLPASTMVMFSAGPGQKALDGAAGQNSPFTAALVKRLRSPGQSMFDAFLGTSDDVVAAVEKLGNQQEPWVKFDGAGRVFREMVLVPGNNPVPAQPVPSSGGQAPAPADPRAGDNSLDLGAVGKTFVARLPGDVKGAAREMTFCYCPPGSFTMGSPESEEDRQDDEEQVTVKISRGFWLAKTECTINQWTAVMVVYPDGFRLDQMPVENVDWDDVQRFIDKLNRTAELPQGWMWALPTEEQWEYGCRAGTTLPFSFGASLSSRQANFDGSLPFGDADKGPDVGQPVKVGSYPANPWGLHDMHGNVSEWCMDSYKMQLGAEADQDDETDQESPDEEDARVYRGGSWDDFAYQCRASHRESWPSRFGSSKLGFRLALVPSK